MNQIFQYLFRLLASGRNALLSTKFVFLKWGYLAIAVLIAVLLCVIWELRTKTIRSWLRRIRNLERVILILLAGCMVIVLCLSWWGARQKPKPEDCWFFVGIKAAFDILGGDSKDFRANASFLPIVPEILSCAVPLLTVAATLGLLWNYLPHHVPYGAQVWYLFSELDINSVRMARSLSREGSLCIFLRTQRGKADTELLAELQEIDYFLYPQDESRFLLYSWRRKHKMRFFFLSDNSDENFSRMRLFLENVKRKELFRPGREKDVGEFRQELYLLAETESASMLIEHLRTMMYQDGKRLSVFDGTELRLLDRYRSVSWDLLRKQPLHKFVADGKLNVLVLGFGRVGQAFFRAACSQGVIHNCTTKFTLCDQTMNSKLDAFSAQYPELGNFVTIRSRELDADTRVLEDLVKNTDFHYIVVALGDDERDIRVASRLKQFYRARHWEAMSQNRSQADTSPQICVHIEDAIKQDYTRQLWQTEKDWDHPLFVFGGLEQTFTREVLMPEELWNAARWIHRQLNNMAADAPVTWSEYERRSSIACAAHAEYHVASMRTGAGETYAERLSRSTLEERDGLIDTEHRRWMAYVCSEGMCKADIDLVEAYYNEIGCRHVDTLGKLTPCLVETKEELKGIWEHLAANHPEQYDGKTPFRKRDEFLVLNAEVIAQGIETGEFSQSAVTGSETAGEPAPCG